MQIDGGGGGAAQKDLVWDFHIAAPEGGRAGGEMPSCVDFLLNTPETF